MVFSPVTKRCGFELLKSPQTLAGIVLRGRTDAAFTVRTDDLRFAAPDDQFFRSAAALFLNFDWGSGIADFTPAIQVSRSSTLTLKISDRFGSYRSEPLTAKFSLWLNPCVSFYELESGRAFVEKNLEFTRGSADIKFKFSGSSCAEASLDVTDARNFRVELFQGEQTRVQSSAFTLTGNEVSIASSLTSFIPVDEPFFLICSARFQGAAGDTQWLSIVLKLTWKPAISLSLPALNLGVPQGRDLLVDASNATLINSATDQRLTWNWLCPADFDCSGLATRQTSFKIAFS